MMWWLVQVKEADVDVKALLAVEDLEKKTALALAKESVEPSADKVLEMLQQVGEPSEQASGSQAA